MMELRSVVALFLAGMCLRVEVQAQQQEAPRQQPVASGWTGLIRAGITVDLDTSSARTGTSSGHIKNTVDGVGYLRQLLRPESFAAKRVRFSAYVKTLGIAGSVPRGAGLWMRIDGDRGTVGFDNMAERAIVRSADWTKYEIVLDVPSKAIGITFGLLLSTPGDAWIDDVTVEVVEKEVRATKPSLATVMQVPPAALAKTKQEYASAGSQPVNLGFEDRR